VLLQRASVYATQGRLELARQELEGLVKEYPHFAEAHAALATVYYRLKRTADGDRAREAARRARLAGQAPAQAEGAPQAAVQAKPAAGAKRPAESKPAGKQ
jgi:Tfp pilus assembly protein PilF